MNLLLLEPEDFITQSQVRLSGRRLKHMLEVQRVKAGDRLRCGLIDGLRGEATLQQITAEHADLSVELNTPPPPPLPLTLVMALPRPKMLKRILQTSATLGIKQIYLINAYRVEKSYWSTPILEPPSINEHLRLGLEQAGDTQMPELHLRRLFRPFVEDELPQLAKDRRALIAHPYNAASCPPAEECDTLVTIGPEGGFIPFEIELMQQQGLQAFHLGERILRVETALPVICSRLFPLI